MRTLRLVASTREPKPVEIPEPVSGSSDVVIAVGAAGGKTIARLRATTVSACARCRGWRTPSSHTTRLTMRDDPPNVSARRSSHQQAPFRQGTLDDAATVQPVNCRSEPGIHYAAKNPRAAKNPWAAKSSADNTAAQHHSRGIAIPSCTSVASVKPPTSNRFAVITPRPRAAAGDRDSSRFHWSARIGR